MCATDALAEFNRQLADKHLLGFWNAGNIAETYQPKASYEPCLWRWSDVYGGLMKAGELLTGVQLVKPDEVTEAHRHTSSMIYHAFRGGVSLLSAGKALNGAKEIALPFPSGNGTTTSTESKDAAILFVMNDQPVLDALGFYREEANST